MELEQQGSVHWKAITDREQADMILWRYRKMIGLLAKCKYFNASFHKWDVCAAFLILQNSFLMYAMYLREIEQDPIFSVKCCPVISNRLSILRFSFKFGCAFPQNLKFQLHVL